MNTIAPSAAQPITLPVSCTAFHGSAQVVRGDLMQVALACKPRVDAGASILIFDDASAQPVEVDFRGSPAEMQARVELLLSVARAHQARRPAPGNAVSVEGPPALPRSPGRPRLGVVGREVTLLPRHWDWLNTQSGGASVALRKLVEQARRANESRDRARRSQEAAFRFMSAVAGDAPGFEEASRALFAGDAARFDAQTHAWPRDVARYARELAAGAFEFGKVA